MSMLSISSHMCSQTTHNPSSSPGSTLFFSYMRMVVYVNFRTLMSNQKYKILILLNKIPFHNVCNIQREYNNVSSERKKINLSELPKVTLTPSHSLCIEGDLTKIFSEIMEINHRI